MNLSCVGLLLIGIIFDGMVLALDWKDDGVVLDLPPKRGRDVVELHKLPLNGDEFICERRVGSEHRLGLIEDVLADVNNITHGEWGTGIDLLGPDRSTKESANHVDEDVLIEILRSVDLELAFSVNRDGQHGGKYVFNPFFPLEEVLAQAIDDVVSILGDGNELILAGGSLIVQDGIGATGDEPGLGVLNLVHEEAAKIHVGLVLLLLNCLMLFDL